MASLTAEPGRVETGAAPRAVSRVAAVDLLRGLVIVVMALDHARDYFSAYPYPPTDLSKASALLFLTRWITHFCAPVFMFLAGSSAWLHARNGGLSRGALQRFLLTRGLWLVVLELTWNSFMWRFDLAGLNVQVLWALGWSMMILATMLWLPRAAILAIGLVIVFGHDLFDGVKPADFGAEGSPGAIAWHIAHVPYFGATAGGFQLIELYPLLPWCGVMMLGFCFGAMLDWEKPRRERFMRFAGLAALALFLLLRLTNAYGEPATTAFGEDHVWRANPRGPVFTLLGVLNVDKYPPSLLYLLMTLGAALLLMPRLERWRGRVADFFTVFGRVPMFFYLLHVPLIHGASAMATTLLFGHAAGLGDGPPPGYEPSLLPVYFAWLVAVAILYPACGWYAGYKRRHRERWWLSYL